jgi:glycine cleavage system transcriptional repressor
MLQQAVLAGIGVDRTGIIDEVSQFLLERSIDIVETQLCNMRGTASFLLVVSGQPEAMTRLGTELGTLSAFARMTVDLLPAKALEETAPMVGFPYRLISRGRDQAGVVNRLSHLLRVLNVNIENFKIDPAGAVSGGDSGFELNLLLSVPRETPVGMLRGYLEQLCGEIGITCDLMCA